MPLHLCPDIKRTEDGCGKVSKALISESGDMHKSSKVLCDGGEHGMGVCNKDSEIGLQPGH